MWLFTFSLCVCDPLVVLEVAKSCGVPRFLSEAKASAACCDIYLLVLLIWTKEWLHVVHYSRDECYCTVATTLAIFRGGRCSPMARASSAASLIDSLMVG